MNANSNNSLAIPTIVTSSGGEDPPIALREDLNNDDTRNPEDAIIGLQIMTGLTNGNVRLDYNNAGVDVNQDYQVGMAEVIYILGRAAGN